ncbi:MAG: MarR family transcriptional regulator [Kofleriaceae bacterium]|nr:MarR family transcriptional regulator [Kofleriaceae bacterium]
MPRREPTLQPLGDTLLFMHQLWELAHALQVRSKRMARTLGVTSPQRLVIRVLGQSPGITARELAGALGIHPSTLTGVLARLEKRELIARKVDAVDRRRARFELTEKGKRIDREKKGTVEAAVRRALDKAGGPTVGKTSEMLGLLVQELVKPD